MTVIFKIGHFPLTSETFIVNHIVETIKKGFEVKILVQKITDASIFYEDLFGEYRIMEKLIEQDYNIPENRSTRTFKALGILLKNFGEIGAIIRYYRTKKKLNLSILFEWSFFRQFRYTDLFHVQYGTNSKPLDDLKKSGYFRMPLVVTFHGHDSFFPINGFIKKEGYYDHIFASADLITVNTPYLEKQLNAIGCPPERLTTVPMPVNCDFFRAKSYIPVTGRDINILSVGRLEPIKGHKFGILAVNELVKKGYGINYKIIGSGSIGKDLKTLVKELGLQKNVKFIGPLPQEEIRKFYCEANIFLMTSVTVNGDTRETQGLVSLEAQASGLPVVAFRSGGVPYTIKERETGILVEEENHLEMAEAVEMLIRNPDLLERMSIKGPGFVRENFSNEKISEFWKEKYRELISCAKVS